MAMRFRPESPSPLGHELKAINECLNHGRLWLRIPEHLYKHFVVTHRRDAAKAFSVRWLFIAALYVFLSAGIYQLMPDEDRLEWMAYYGMVGVVILVVAVLSRNRKLDFYFPYYAGLGSFIAMAISVYSTSIVEDPYANQLTHAAIMYAIFIIYSLVGLSFIASITACWMGGIFGIIAIALSSGNVDWEVMLRSYVGSSLIAMMIAYYLDQGYRRNFLQSALMRIDQRTMAEYASHVMELSRLDPLTGLANRRHFEQSIELTWRRAFRDRRPVAFIMVDVDHFKAFNDTWGHAAGDQCLKQVADTIQVFGGRASDLAVRLGGEEFLLVLPDADVNGAARVADQMREKIGKLDISVEEGKTVHITASMGVSSAIPSDTMSVDQLLEEADQALYEAKESGRNRVRIHSPVLAQ